MLSYAEIHYKPLSFPCLLFKKQPEIVFDMPLRIGPGKPIPLFLIIKDANIFPVTIDKIEVNINYNGKLFKKAVFPYNSEIINSEIWWDCLNIIPEHTGMLIIEPTIFYTCAGKKHSAIKDNYRGLSQRQLISVVADKPLPGVKGWYGGDIHCHSFYTNDQVEFGAPLEVTAFAAFCMGLDWISATDHSYDLDNQEGNYSKSDPGFFKWFMMREKSRMLGNSIAVIPGEEVTCMSKNGSNCHLLSIDSEKFIPGSGDSGEKGFNKKSEKSIGEAVNICIEWGGLPCAAHPLEYVPLLERIILGRGKWTERDFNNPGLQSIQFYNGCRDSGFNDGMNLWIRMLLNGRRLYAFGGNDSHGDFNSVRKMGIPFITITESHENVLGRVRTIVRAESGTAGHIVEGLKKGEAVVTDGPFIDLRAYCGSDIVHPGGEVVFEKTFLETDFVSSEEFGALSVMKILGGVKNDKKEKLLFIEHPKEKIYSFSIKNNIDCKGLLYIRAECRTDAGGFCFTNPVWVA
jgi:hypothetical protein